jgi:hypothetical protein
VVSYEEKDRFEDQFSLDDLRVEPLESRLEFGSCGCTVCDSWGGGPIRDGQPIDILVVSGNCG